MTLFYSVLCQDGSKYDFPWGRRGKALAVKMAWERGYRENGGYALVEIMDDKEGIIDDMEVA